MLHGIRTESDGQEMTAARLRLFAHHPHVLRAEGAKWFGEVSDVAPFHWHFQAAAAHYEVPELQSLTSAAHLSFAESEAERKEVVKYLYPLDQDLVEH